MLSVVLQLSFIISQATKLWLIKFLLLLLQLLFLFLSVLFCSVLWPKVICMKSASEFYLMRRSAQLQGRKLTPREDWDNWIHWLVRGGRGRTERGSVEQDCCAVSALIAATQADTFAEQAELSWSPGVAWLGVLGQLFINTSCGSTQTKLELWLKCDWNANESPGRRRRTSKCT